MPAMVEAQVAGLVEIPVGFVNICTLDAQSGHTAMELLRAVAIGPDRAVIVVSHDNRIFAFADRIVHMEDGRITGVERSAAIREEV
jgi:ABC-type lipoprotein export system ATPase subunit